MASNLFEALSAVERRRVLVGLLEHNPQDALVTDETEAGIDETVIARQHVHLPKLEDYGFVSWDRNEDVVTKGPRFDEIRPALELLDDHSDDLPLEWV